MLDKKDQVLYVGKAKNLPNRLKSYALDKNQPIRTERMLALTNNLEIITTNSEAEALLLEANLIKNHTFHHSSDEVNPTVNVGSGLDYAVNNWQTKHYKYIKSINRNFASISKISFFHWNIILSA